MALAHFHQIGILDTPGFVATSYTGSAANADALARANLGATFALGSVVQLPDGWITHNYYGRIPIAMLGASPEEERVLSQFPPDVQGKLRAELTALRVNKRSLEAASAVSDFVQTGNMSRDQMAAIVSGSIALVNPIAGAMVYTALKGAYAITDAFLAVAEQFGWTAKGSVADPTDCMDPYCDGRRKQYDVNLQSPGGCCRWCGLIDLNTETIPPPGSSNWYQWATTLPAGIPKRVCASSIDARASFEVLSAQARYLWCLDWIDHEIQRDNLKSDSFKLFYYMTLKFMWEQRANCLIPKVDSRLVLYNCLALWNGMHEVKSRDRLDKLLTESYIPLSIRRPPKGNWAPALEWNTEPFVSYIAWVLHSEYDTDQGSCASAFDVSGNTPVSSTILAPSQVQGQRIEVHTGALKPNPLTSGSIHTQILNRQTAAILDSIASTRDGLIRPSEPSGFPWGIAALVVSGLAGGLYLYSRKHNQTMGQSVRRLVGRK